MNDMPRKKVSAAELHDILAREFRGSAGDSCLKCGIPMPVYLRGGTKGASNWRIGAIDECSTLCHSILEEIAASAAAMYELKAPR